MEEKIELDVRAVVDTYNKLHVVKMTSLAEMHGGAWEPLTEEDGDASTAPQQEAAVSA